MERFIGKEEILDSSAFVLSFTLFDQEGLESLIGLWTRCAHLGCSRSWVTHDLVSKGQIPRTLEPTA